MILSETLKKLCVGLIFIPDGNWVEGRSSEVKREKNHIDQDYSVCQRHAISEAEQDKLMKFPEKYGNECVY